MPRRLPALCLGVCLMFGLMACSQAPVPVSITPAADSTVEVVY